MELGFRSWLVDRLVANWASPVDGHERAHDEHALGMAPMAGRATGPLVSRMRFRQGEFGFDLLANDAGVGRVYDGDALSLAKQVAAALFGGEMDRNPRRETVVWIGMDAVVDAPFFRTLFELSHVFLLLVVKQLLTPVLLGEIIGNCFSIIFPSKKDVY